jgi:hypothetical protein
MGKIEGEGSISPETMAIYKQEFQRGMNLFEQSLHEYQNTEAGPKKDKFKEVMELTMQVMNETAKLALSKSAQKTEGVLEQDYQSYISDSSEDNLNKLQGDIDKLHKLL